MCNTSIVKEEEPCLTGIGTEPSFAIGQRAQLVQTAQGNVLWESLSVVDDAGLEAIRARGGLAAIAISHPHYYSSMIEWSQAFGGVPIYLHAAERQWVMRPDPAIVFWEGETHPLLGGLTLIRCGGHFEGAQVLHWPAGAVRRIAQAIEPFTYDRIYSARFDRTVLSGAREAMSRSVSRYLGAIAVFGT